MSFGKAFGRPSVRRIVAAVSVTSAAVASSLVAAAPAQAYSVKNNCGIVTCSVYFSKDLTREIVVPAKAVSVVSRNVPRIGPVVSRLAGAVASKAAEAARTNGCLRIRYTRSGQIVGLYADHNGAYCRDN